MRKEVDDKLPAPSEAELEAFYADRRNLSNVPFETVRQQLAAELKQQNAVIARQVFLQHLREAADVSVLLLPPRVPVTYDPARVLGNPDAPITIVEFADFECPYCRRASPILREVMEKYKGQVRIAFRDYPLREAHPRAEQAAEAGQCAAEQGKFWAYHDALFTNPVRLTDQDLHQDALSSGLDVTQFDTCMRDGKVKARVEEDLQAGTKAGVSGTPGYFINGIFLSGIQPLAMFENIINEELGSLKAQGN